jgi:hypothetical protein
MQASDYRIFAAQPCHSPQPLPLCVWLPLPFRDDRKPCVHQIQRHPTKPRTIRSPLSDSVAIVNTGAQVEIDVRPIFSIYGWTFRPQERADAGD